MPAIRWLIGDGPVRRVIAEVQGCLFRVLRCVLRQHDDVHVNVAQTALGVVVDRKVDAATVEVSILVERVMTIVAAAVGVRVAAGVAVVVVVVLDTIVRVVVVVARVVVVIGLVVSSWR